ADELGADQKAAVTVTGTLSFVEYVYVGHDNEGRGLYKETHPYELASSILARGAAASRIDGDSRKIDDAVAAYEKACKERPPDQATEVTSNVVQYPRDIQVWEVHVARTARLDGATTKHETKGEQKLHLEYIHVSHDSSKELEGFDQWRREDEVRDDR